MAKRKICVVTGTRAEYGLLFWLMKEIEGDPELTLQLAVTGAHLSPKFGETRKTIEKDGFAIDEKIDIDLGDDTPRGIARSMGMAVIGFGEAFGRLRPDVIVVLGDRYEILAAAEAAMLARTPIAHIHGGEITEGAMDDAMRHAITKLSHLHFTAAEAYCARVIQLGEDPTRVFNTGAIGLDNIDRLTLLDRAGLKADLGLAAGQNFFLVTYHPVTLSNDDPAEGLGEMLAALDEFPDFDVVLTGVNSDPGHDTVARLLAGYVEANPARVSMHASLGQLRYLSAMKYAAAVIGNSSSGIVEAPALGAPTVNIGDRQKGRLRAPSIIDCGSATDDIAQAIERALNPGFRSGLKEINLPYGSSGASKKIKNILKTADLSGIVQKPFHDIPYKRAAS
ncbi:MAG: UDP-N-acetylglucosamine 2-epimerase (hydrolyzing) [Rhodospirillales bacterium]|nr:UDP-N-acetylglucosamine 2-epimerase (hydrolyzing) [Rhodospirillales bacterium]